MDEHDRRNSSTAILGLHNDGIFVVSSDQLAARHKGISADVSPIDST